MKSITHPLAAAALSLFALAASIPKAQAADIRLEGSGYYQFGKYETFSKYGVSQSGRYNNLGRDYYHKTEIGMDFLTNWSNSKSGSLSFEFWAMPFYGASSGIVLMTIGSSPLAGGFSKKNFHVNGSAVSLDAYKYPELNIWEFTRNGWKFRDALSFTRKSLL